MEKVTRNFVTAFHPVFNRQMYKIWKQQLK
jgi:hypothetical protein